MKALTFKVTFCLLPTVLVHVIAAQPTNSGLYDVAVLDTSTVIVVGGNGTCCARQMVETTGHNK